ncbi:uncharacterized protein LOC144597072 [Rhinoraja longicauda]
MTPLHVDINSSFRRVPAVSENLASNMVRQLLPSLFLALSAALGLQATPILLQHPEVMRLQKGKTAEMQCTMKNHSVEATTVYWDRLVPGDKRRWLLTHSIYNYITKSHVISDHIHSSRDLASNSFILTIVGVQPSDAAIYTCSVWGSVYGEGTQLIVSNTNPPTLFQFPRLERVTEGHTARLRCSMENAEVGTTDVHWYRELPGQEMEWVLTHEAGGSVRRRPGFTERFQPFRDASNSSFILTVTNVTLTDSAAYYCTVWGDISENGTQVIVISRDIDRNGTQVKLTSGEKSKVENDLNEINEVTSWNYPNVTDDELSTNASKQTPGTEELAWTGNEQNVTSGKNFASEDEFSGSIFWIVKELDGTNGKISHIGNDMNGDDGERPRNGTELKLSRGESEQNTTSGGISRSENLIINTDEDSSGSEKYQNGGTLYSQVTIGNESGGLYKQNVSNGKLSISLNNQNESFGDRWQMGNGTDGTSEEISGDGNVLTRTVDETAVDGKGLNGSDDRTSRDGNKLNGTDGDISKDGNQLNGSRREISLEGNKPIGMDRNISKNGNEFNRTGGETSGAGNEGTGGEISGDGNEANETGGEISMDGNEINGTDEETSGDGHELNPLTGKIAWALKHWKKNLKESAKISKKHYQASGLIIGNGLSEVSDERSWGLNNLNKSGGRYNQTKREMIANGNELNRKNGEIPKHENALNTTSYRISRIGKKPKVISYTISNNASKEKAKRGNNLSENTKEKSRIGNKVKPTSRETSRIETRESGTAGMVSQIEAHMSKKRGEISDTGVSRGGSSDKTSWIGNTVNGFSDKTPWIGNAVNESSDKTTHIGNVVNGTSDEAPWIGNMMNGFTDESSNTWIGNVMNGSHEETPRIGNVVHGSNYSSQIGNMVNGSHEDIPWIRNMMNGSNDSAQIGNMVNGSNNESAWIGNVVHGSNDGSQIGNVMNGSHEETPWIGNAINGSNDSSQIGNVVNGSHEATPWIGNVMSGSHEETPWIGNVMNGCNDCSQSGNVVHGSNDSSQIRNVVRESNDSSQIWNMVNGTRVETAWIANEVNGDASGILSTGHLNVSNNTDPGEITRDGSVYGNELNGTDEPLPWFGNELQGSNNEIPRNASRQSSTDGDDSWNAKQLNVTDGNMESLVNGGEIARNGSELNGTSEAVALIRTSGQPTSVGSDGNETTIDRCGVEKKPSGTGQNLVMNEVYPNRSNEGLSQYKNEPEETNDEIGQTEKVINSGEISSNVSVQNLSTAERSWIWNELDETSEETARDVMKQNGSCGDIFCDKDQMNGTSEEMPGNGSESNGSFIGHPLNEINGGIHWNGNKHGKISRKLSDRDGSDWVIYTTENGQGVMNEDSSLIENQSIGVSGELSKDDDELNGPSEEGSRIKTKPNQKCAEKPVSGNNDTNSRMRKKATSYALSRKASKQKVNSGKTSPIKNTPSKPNAGASRVGTKLTGAKHPPSVSQQKISGKDDEKPKSGKTQSETHGEIPRNKMELNRTQEEMEGIGNKQNGTNDTASLIENELNVTNEKISKIGNNQNDSRSGNELNRMGGELKGVGAEISFNTSKTNITHRDAFWNGNQLNETTEDPARGGSKVNGAGGEIAMNRNELTATNGEKSSTVAKSDISRNASNVTATSREASSFRNNHVSIRQITWNGTEQSGTEEETSLDEHERNRKEGEASSIRFMQNEDISVRSWNESKLTGTSRDVSLIERQMNGAAYIVPRTEKRLKTASNKIARNTAKQKAASGDISRIGKESKSSDKIFRSYETNGLLSKNMNEVSGSVSNTGIKVNETSRETARNAFKRNITRGNISGIGNDLNASTENVSTKKSVQYMNHGGTSKNGKEQKDGIKSWIGNDLQGDNEGTSRDGTKLSGKQGGISWSQSEKVQPEESSRSGENETGINGEESRNETDLTVTTEEIDQNGTELTTPSAWNTHLVLVLLVSFLGTLFFLLAILLVVLLHVKGLVCFSREATQHSASVLMQQDPRKMFHDKAR